MVATKRKRQYKRRYSKNPWTPELKRLLKKYTVRGTKVETPDGPGTITEIRDKAGNLRARAQLFADAKAKFMVVLDKPVLLEDIIRDFPDEPQEEWPSTTIVTMKPSKDMKTEELKNLGVLRVKDDEFVVLGQYYLFPDIQIKNPKKGQIVSLDLNEKILPVRFILYKNDVLMFESLDPITSKLFESRYGRNSIEWESVKEGFFSNFIHVIPWHWIDQMKEIKFKPKVSLKGKEIKTEAYERQSNPEGKLIELDNPIPFKNMEKVLLDYGKARVKQYKDMLNKGEIDQYEYEQSTEPFLDKDAIRDTLKDVSLMYIIPTKLNFTIRPLHEDIAEGISMELELSKQHGYGEPPATEYWEVE